MCRKTILFVTAVLALGLLFGVASAQLRVAEDLLVDLTAEDLPYGDVTDDWPNRGTMGDFVPFGTPVVEDVGGLKTVTFDGASWFEGPTSVAGIEGAETRSIEVWALNPAIPGEETMVSWAHRGGPDGTNIAFNYGNHGTWGAVGHWGSPDMGWDTNHSPAPEAGKWWHLAYTYDGTACRIYVNGEQESIDPALSLNTHAGNIIRVGAQADGSGAGATFQFTGSIAEVRIHDGVLSPEDIQNNFGLGGPKRASSPSPGDGAVDVAMPLLQWQAGMTALWHDVYFGQTPNLGPGHLVVRNPANTTMYWHGPGIVPGETYYWRVDEVQADGTVYTGVVWTFTAAPVTAFMPSPADEAKFQPADVQLTWLPGQGAQSRDVYFGTNKADVENGTPDTFKGNQFTVGFDPGPLQLGTTYYWRVDAIGPTGKQVGPVWSFQTIPDIAVSDPNLVGWWKLDEGQGTLALDSSGQGNHGEVRGGTQWIEGYDGGALRLKGLDGYVNLPIGQVIASLDSTTITAWVDFSNAGGAWQRIFDFGSGTGVYIFLCPRTGTAGGMRLAITIAGGGGESLIDTGETLPSGWRHVAAVVRAGSMRLYLDGVTVASGSTSVVPSDLGATAANWIGRSQYSADGYFNGAVDDFRIYDFAMTAEQIPETMRGDPMLAWDPNPANQSIVDIEHAAALTWSPGEQASQHDVYLGADKALVEAANTDTAGIYRIRQPGTSYTPPEQLEWGRTYHWRIDEVNADASISTGRVWSFTVADYLIVDDFEDYNDFSNRIFYTWIDGFGYTTPPPGSPGNGTNSTVGNIDPPFAETSVVHSGSQALVMEFDNATNPWIAEADRTFASPQDWTRLDIKALTLWYRGLPLSPGGFSYDTPTGTYTVTGYGNDIWNDADQFLFVYKTLTGNGSITARIDSVEAVHDWAKASVMIRNTLDPNSENAYVVITPQDRPNTRVSFQYRVTAGVNAQGTNGAVDEFTLPHWVRLTREGNTLTGQHSADGVTWVDIVDPGVIDAPTAISIPGINPTVYIGLAVTSHLDASSPATATFSNVTVTGGVAPGAFTDSADIVPDRTFNANEPMYLVVESGAQSAILENPDPNALIQTSYQPWDIPISDLVAKGVNPAGITKMSIGVGNKQTPAVGGKGTLYVDDIRLYRSHCVPYKAQPDADFDDNCLVDYADLDIMVGEWLLQADVDTTLTTDLNADDVVDLADYALLADEWMELALWP